MNERTAQIEKVAAEGKGTESGNAQSTSTFNSLFFLTLLIVLFSSGRIESRIN